MLKYLAYVFLVTAPLYSLQDSPWLGNDKEFDLRAYASYQNSEEMALKNHAQDEEMHSFLNCLQLGISPFHPWGIEAEVNLGANRGHSSYAYIGSKLRLKRQFYSDLVGDPFTLTGGISLIIPKNKNVVDLREVPYANVNSDIYLSAGREIARGGSYSHRFYVLGAVGMKSAGRGWLRLKLNFERNYMDKYRLEGFLEAASSFKGAEKPKSYESPRALYKAAFHQLDLGVCFHYRVDFVGEWSLGLSKRIKGRWVVHRPLEVFAGFYVPFFP